MWPRTIIAFGVSLLLHGLAIYGLSAIIVDTGLGEHLTEIISESAIDTVVVEAVPGETVQAAAASVAQQETKSVATHEEEQKPPEPEPEPKVEQKQPDPPVEQPQLPVNETAEVKTEEAKERKAEEHRKEPTHKRQDEKRKVEKQARKASEAALGGKHGGSKGQVSASRGDMLSYASRVQARVRRSRPGGNGVGNDTAVSFGISATGNLNFVSITQSSGSRERDRLAILAVRRASPFPPPPNGKANTFNMTFHFKYQ